MNKETGEFDPCEHCEAFQDEIRGLERDVRAWRMRYAVLEKDSDKNAKEHELWTVVSELFKHWKKACRHPKSRMTADRFWVAMPHVRGLGEEVCRDAIDGAAYDPHTEIRRNGTVKRYDDWELIFRNRGKVEDFANRHPKYGRGK